MTLKRIIKKLIKVSTGCTILYKTNWYKSLFVDLNHEIYPDNNWYRIHDERNFDIVNLGSSSAKWAFDYSDTTVKGMNWAQQPQTLLEDFNLLRHYHSILRKGGYVIITIMPFTSLNKNTNVFDAIKYLKIDTQGEPIQPHKIKEAQKYAEYPILMKKSGVKALIKYFLGRNFNINQSVNQLEYNPMTTEELEKDALNWVNIWKKQFEIVDFDAPLTIKNKEGRNYRIKLMRDLIDFSTERGYNPIYVIPPVTNHLSQYYTSKFEETYIYSYLREIDRDISILDYSKDKSLMNDDLYFNSFFLNKQGRKLFSKRVLQDIKFI